MRRRNGDGVPAARKPSGPISCSQGTDWAADEHVEVQSAYKHFKSEKRTAACLQHTILKSTKRRCLWSQEEDDILIKMVNLHSSSKWSTIACSIPGRSPHQCRERWIYCLHPDVNKQPWSEQEERTLIHAHQIHGNKWSELAKKYFPGRTGKAIMNHWASLKDKKAKSLRGLPEQFPHMPTDPLITKIKGTTASESCQDSYTMNNHVSPEVPIPKLEQVLAKAGGNPSSLNGKTSDPIHVTKESVNRKVSFPLADFPRSEQEEVTDSVAVLRPTTDFSPARNVLSSSDHSDGICSSEDSASQEPHLANLEELLDMSYCESLMIIPPNFSK